MTDQGTYRYIAIEGNIGAGKSTLATQLAKDWSSTLILEEFEDNSFLPKFYKDPRRYAFPLEMSFLAARFNQLKNKLTEPDLFNKQTISDYIFAKCLLFSKVNLDEDEYELYSKLFTIIQLQLPKPDLLVYLHTPIHKLQHHIAKRGRVYEQQIKDEYLLNLQNAYFSYLHANPDLRILLVDCTHLNFVENPEHYAFLKNLFQQAHEPGLHTINPRIT